MYYMQILRCVRSGIKFKDEFCVAIRLCLLARELQFDEDSIIKGIKASNTGSNNINKDFLLPTKRDSFVKRGVNSVSARSAVIWTSFIPPEILTELEKGMLFSLSSQELYRWHSYRVIVLLLW